MILFRNFRSNEANNPIVYSTGRYVAEVKNKWTDMSGNDNVTHIHISRTRKGRLCSDVFLRFFFLVLQRESLQLCIKRKYILETTMHTTGEDSCGNIPHGSPHDDDHVTIDISHGCDDESSLNDRKAVKAFEKRPCSCLQEGTECKCGSSSKSRFSIRLEPWACYKTFLMSGVIILMIVWLVCFLTLMHKNVL